MTGPGAMPARPGPRDVHVWRGCLDGSPAAVARLSRWLAGEERERARRLIFPRDRTRYIAGRGQLRRLLGAYLERDPGAIELVYGAFGKPALAGGELSFNVAHAGAHLLVAVTSVAEVGIDLELEGTQVDGEHIAEHFFSPAEVAALRGLRPDQQPRAFLCGWTRKEAFVKARGDGLQRPLESFDVSLAPGQPVALERTAWSHSEPTEWSLTDLSDASAGYIAALAVRCAGPVSIRRLNLPGIDGLASEEEDQP